jgi:hypothetical protein
MYFNIFLLDGVEVVHCSGNYGHWYPFEDDYYLEGTKILWQFMKSHAKA